MTDTMKTEPSEQKVLRTIATGEVARGVGASYAEGSWTLTADQLLAVCEKVWQAALDSQAAQAQPHSEAVLKLLDEIESYLKEAQYYMDEEDRRGGAHGLYEKVRKYLIDVGYTYIQRVSTSHEGRQHE